MKDDRLTVQQLARLLAELPTKVQDYEVWHEADPSFPVYATDLVVDHENHQVWL